MEARDLVERAGVELDGSNDQHFLVDDRLLERIAGYPETEGDAHVLEVGGGVGNLTRHLVEGFDRVTVVEIDPELAGFLEALLEVA
ncbi:MAG: rRNA adenine N-6-methyltransferase family protein, partial [Halobacteria archaeon]|nr:rRNA adenine N-6-methyltransferase family protein [Halobacteria archaeon]